MTEGSSPSGIDFVITSAKRVLDYAGRWGGATALLPRAELDTADRFRNPADGRAYIGAHILFRSMAVNVLGIPMEKSSGLAVHRKCHSCGGPHGKPMIEGTSLSLSRSGQTVLVASGPAGIPLGADLESVPASLHAGFDDFSLSATEQAGLACSDIESRIRLWVAKEAALKVHGHGLTVEPRRLHLGPAEQGLSTPSGWSVDVEAPSHGDLDGLHIAWLRAPAGLTAAVASTLRASIRELDLAQSLFASRLHYSSPRTS
ncbi:4'-phosphopantetheinyl transferase family protein [Arthrobacter glacialis]|uniref:4'-phosphopantetheinyl transferase domain-containing protein n=1 Tax=Arthrobacter glacialis TaxID=1664 RepID=A0A2S3ZXG6_ARTGL|nr:4'-phosphopantetheinyl transferase superfamily protein [Arthrobacter glacialis]POH73587.1 hypothetical protein CVS27_09420 [Arthrobacter glacialis]